MEPLNILYAGNVHLPQSSENSVVRQLVRDGHRVTGFKYPTVRGTDYDEVNKKLLEILEKNKFDLFVGTKCMGLGTDMINQIKIPKVSWVFDLFKGYTTWKRSEWYEKQAVAWDACFGSEAGQVKYYMDKGINYFPLKAGADPEWHKKIDYDSDYNELKCDVSFLGGIYNPLRTGMDSRIKVIPNILYKNYVGYEVGKIMIPGVYMGDISGLAHVCKITIGCNYRNDVKGYWSKRPYELMGSNLFMIQAYVEGMEKEGFNNKNTVFYHNDNFDEMAEKIEFYLRKDNEAEREKIREAGYQFIHSKHMMVHRTKVFFDILKKEGIL